MTYLDVYRKSIELIESDAPFVLATVVRSLGSTPQKVGANAIFEPNGKVHGTLGGGCLEAEARRRALDALDEGRTILFHVKLDDISGWDDGLICGGQATILIQPNPFDSLSAMKSLVDCEQHGGAGAMVTSILRSASVSSNSTWVIEEDLKKEEWKELAEALESALKQEKPSLIGEYSTAESNLYFVEPCLPQPELLIAGAGHVGKAVSMLASKMGFRVVIVDDRSEFACPENLPSADEIICGNIPDTIAKWPIQENTFIVIVTRGHQHDGASLAACVQSSACFIGMIGSRRKSLLIRQSLLEKGLASVEQLNHVVCPIGLDIGSISVNEIALSIVSQLVAYRRKGALDASSMTFSRP